MNPSQLVSISLFTMALVLTLSVLSERWRGTNPALKEAFSLQNDEIVQSIVKANEPIPSDADAVTAHQTLLRYIRNDFSKGIKFVMALKTAFFEPSTKLNPDLDVRRLLDNYISPLQAV
jgi:hypothetical protein